MKKILWAVAFLLINFPAWGGEFVYDYSGQVDGFYGYSDYADKYRRNHKQNHTPAFAEIYTSFGYYFDETTEIKLGVDAQISDGKEVEDYNHGEWGENIYVALASEYGEFVVGQVYNAAYQLAVGAPSVGAFRVNNSPITDFIANPNWQRHSRVASYRTLNSTYLNTDADAFKMSYITSEFYGAKAAFSYTPDSYSAAGLINKYSRYDNRSSYSVGLYHGFEFAAAEIESSLGYAFNHKNNQEVSVGIRVYRKGWTLGGSYRKSYTSSSDYALGVREHYSQTYDYDGYRRGQAFNVGLNYEIGPLTTGVSYFASFADKTDNEDKIITFANRLAVHKNVAFYLATAYAEYKGAKEVEDNNRGFAFISGLELSF